jgi:hypothetical protein
MKAYRLGAICDAAAAAAALETVGDRLDFMAGSAARRRDVVKKRDRRRTDSARGARRGLNPGRQKPLERLAIVGLMLFEGGRTKEINYSLSWADGWNTIVCGELPSNRCRSMLVG